MPAATPFVALGSSLLIDLSLVILCGLMPVAVLVGRHNVKKFRQRLLLGLEQTYEHAGGSTETLRLVPSFEIARYKYDLTSTEADFAGSGHRACRRGALWRDASIYLLPG